jgi:2-oxo-4-hydroxy-4-carboxy--5-ureidoimidazoline (OHCU) decarboxylase
VSVERPAPPPSGPAPRPQAPPPVDVLDVLSPGTFAASMAPLFEGAPRFLGRLAMARPFDSMDQLYATARHIGHAMPQSEQIELIDAHPRLGAPPGSVSALSFREQGYDHGDVGDLAAAFDHLNSAYEARFGFRYCVFVAGRPRAALLPEFEAALQADRETELHRAIDAVIDIAHDRHARLIAEEAP